MSVPAGDKMALAQIKQIIARATQGVQNAAERFESVAAVAEADASAKQAQDGGFFSGATALSNYYFPNELIGGVCPRIAGQEREIAWHAATEACDTERVQLIWSVSGDKIWYLAARSAEFASHAHTWCPFASFLPGRADAYPAPVCYAYYSDEIAVLMTVTDDSLQVHRGTSTVVRAKAERVARELGMAKVVALDPDVIMKIQPAAWHSVTLFEDRLRRMLSTIVVGFGLFFASIAFFIWLFAVIGIMQQHRQLEDIQDRTRQKTMDLMNDVERMRASLLREQVARFAELNEGLVQVGGWMKFYQIKLSKIRWRAAVPPSVTGDKIKELGAKLLTTNDQGVLIGTDSEPVTKR